jgi:hypothetical protein
MIKERGLMNLAVAGNIVTAWSWFGVNMLGIGLHSYGFTDQAFRWLLIFVASQLLLIGFGLLPKQKWRSFQQQNADGRGQRLERTKLTQPKQTLSTSTSREVIHPIRPEPAGALEFAHAAAKPASTAIITGMGRVPSPARAIVPVDEAIASGADAPRHKN